MADQGILITRPALHVALAIVIPSHGDGSAGTNARQRDFLLVMIPP